MYCKACNKKLDSIYEGMVHGCLSPDIAERDRYKEALEEISTLTFDRKRTAESAFLVAVAKVKQIARKALEDTNGNNKS
jgi:hypothetical protein